MFRRRGDELEVLLGHPGGPFWANKDLSAWTIFKGEMAEGDDALATARREFEEETGFRAEGDFLALGSVKQKGGKVVHAWAFEGDLDSAAIHSNSYRVQWPPGSGQWRSFPEVDRAQWFGLDEARRRINPAQVALLDTLASLSPGRASR
jgi:predicted NUDIX family NTP pyrophosphohydrolase